MPPSLTVFGTVSASTTLIHGVHGIATKYAAAALMSSSLIPLAIVIIVLVLALRGSALFLTPLLKSFMVWMKYSTGSAETAAFSGRPLPFG